MDRIKTVIETNYKIIVCLFFAVFLCIGISVFRDYGLSWDEPYQRYTGKVTYNYVVKGDPTLVTYGDRYYGPVFELFLFGIEKIFGLTKNSRTLYFMRHLVTFLFFYTGVFFFYRLCKYRFDSWKIGLLGSLFLILSPRIFAHSFYNSKDISFVAMFIISIYTLVRYLNEKTLLRASFHAATCAILIDLRILGIIVPFLTIIFLIADLLIIKTVKINAKKIIAGFVIYTFLLISLTILFWPTLWTNPLYHFIEAFKQMSHFTWEESVLYFGDYIKGTNVPWHYIPVWISISTPVLYTAFFLGGCFVTVKSLLKNPTGFYIGKRDDLIFISWFFLPLAAVIVLKSTLYDAWRQMFFIYPAFLIFSLAGLTSLYGYIKIKFRGISYKVLSTAFTFIAAFNLIITAQFMVKYHPYQNVYFNMLAGRNMEEIKSNFELDYWGLSYREALEYILENDTDKVIKIYIDTEPGMLSSEILTSDDRNRLKYVPDPLQATYYLSNYRWHKDEYALDDPYYSIEIAGTKIMVVYRLK